MTHATFMELIDEAKREGESDENAGSVLREDFETWVYVAVAKHEDADSVELTEEEDAVLWKAYQEGFGIKFD